MKAEHLDAYGEEPGPVLYAERIEPAEPAKEEVIQFLMKPLYANFFGVSKPRTPTANW